jgi:DNA invertase Pin-like site-specific DNA recombinase
MWAVIFTRARVVPANSVQEYDQLSAQRLACQAVAERLGAGVAATYEARGGTTEASVRAAVEEMLNFVRDYKIDYLIVQSCDRLTRRPYELIRIALWLKNAGTDLVTIARPESEFLRAVFDLEPIAITTERRAA